jgi:hypothetical protein
MNITPQILSIPPYLSTTWKNISSMHAVPEGDTFKLFVMLASRMRVVIPDLDKASIDTIFEAHARYGSLPIDSPAPQENRAPSVSFPLPTSGSGLELLNAASQHNPTQADSPELPKEILEKIAGIAKVLGLDNAEHLPKAEPHCNCPYCQIARAFQGAPQQEAIEAKSEEEIVSEEDLKFRNWDIKQSADQLYAVTNPFDQEESYSVYLGEPLGCTCGEKNCEHIRAVLNS